MKGLHIKATGRCLPKKILTNDDLSRMVDTNDEWITTRTGIKQRHICDGERNIDLAIGAATRALEKAAVRPEEIGALVVTTFTPDYYTPAVACLLAKALGLSHDIPAFDMNAACSGFLYALQVANGLLLQEERPYALIVGSEVISKITDWSDRSTCVLFGDGAGAALVERREVGAFCTALGCDGNAVPIYCGGAGDEDRFIRMDGGEVFKFAVRIIPQTVEALLQKSGLTLADIDYFVCHQANKRIIDSAAKKLKAPQEKFFINLDRYGNTSSASIPIALDEMGEAGLLKPGVKTLCVGFGAGFTWGGAILEW